MEARTQMTYARRGEITDAMSLSPSAKDFALTIRHEVAGGACHLASCISSAAHRRISLIPPAELG